MEMLPSVDPKAFVIERELAEVHLLLENISASTEKNLAAAVKDEAMPPDWLKEICRIGWPPQGADPVEQAALLIKAKDYLNGLTKPATGATIAFTLLVTQEGGANWLVLLWRQLFMADPKASTRAAMDPGAKDGVGAARSGQPREAPTRLSLACQAYPDLRDKARSFRIYMGAISIGLIVWLVWTCFLSWDVAVGNANLTQLANANAEQAAADKLLGELSPAGASPESAGSTLPATPGKSPATSNKSPAAFGRTPATTKVQRTPVEAPPVAAALSMDPCAASSEAISQDGSAAQNQVVFAKACRAQGQARDDVRRARDGLTTWLWRWRFLPFRVEPAHPPGPPEADDAYVPDAYASMLANVLGSAVLPVFYGILGAGAAVIRGLSQSIKASILTPRDLNLSIQRLALGAVVGACIGLFVPDAATAAGGGAASGPTLLGPVRLSPAALSFVAGFAVEAVFTALEGLINRIFGLAATGAGSVPR